MFTDQSILITGGTGSFATKFAQILLQNYHPRRLIIYSRDELKQFEMQQDFPQKCMRFFLGDVRDYNRIEEAMHEVDFVIHTAALKQVPAAEYNPMECVKTNIYGAENVIRAAIKNHVKKVMVISTDKATNPINLYGATKLAADKLFVAANNIVGKRKTRFSIVRYGNCIGSRGSIVPYFQKLIQNGAKEIPITDAKMTRFMVTLEAGANFAMQSFKRMQGGETFVPKLPSMYIVDLAKALAPQLPQKIIGLRPGERIYESLCTTDESHLTLEFKDYYVICPTIPFFEVIDYQRNNANEKGQPVDLDFEYNSQNNDHWLNAEQFLRIFQT